MRCTNELRIYIAMTEWIITIVSVTERAARERERWILIENMMLLIVIILNLIILQLLLSRR